MKLLLAVVIFKQTNMFENRQAYALRVKIPHTLLSTITPGLGGIFVLFLFVCIFLVRGRDRETEREHMQGERQTERKQAPL